MYQLSYRLLTPERSLPLRLLAAMAIITVLFSYSHADGRLTEDNVNILNMSYGGAQRTEVVTYASKSHTNDGRQDWFEHSKYEALIDSSTAPGSHKMHKKKRSSEYVKRQVSQEMSNSAGPCELGWTFKGNSCYKLTSRNETWSQAQSECRSMLSLLAEVENSQEQDALHDFLSSQGSEWAWIGLKKRKSDGSWIWSSGRPMSYRNWLRSERENEPNNFGGAENCVNVWPKRNSVWNDYNCTINMPGVCQKGYCGKGWTSTRKSCYKITDAAPRIAAQNECRSMKGSLAEINSSEEQDELYDFLQSQARAGSDVSHPWIGLSDPQKNRVWKWDSGTSLRFQKWAAGEPSNTGGEEYCVNVWHVKGFEWNDVDCSFNFPGVCKQYKGPTGTPAHTSSTIPSFSVSARSATPRSRATVTTADAPGCDVESPLCSALSERGFCTRGIHRHYMAIACRRSCGRCP